MKKILIVLLGLFLFTTSCKKEDEKVDYPSIVGTWKPVKMVLTVVDGSQVLADSQSYYYDECQQESRFVFNEDLSGHVFLKDNYGGLNCILVQDENFTYNYTPKSGKINLQYITLSDEGKISEVTESSMNLQIAVTEGNVYTSKTYTLQKIN